MPVNDNKNSATPPAAIHRSMRKRSLINALIVLVIVAGVVAGALVISHRRPEPASKVLTSENTPQQPYKQTYTKLTDYKLAGPVSGAGAAFQEPQDFSASTVSKSPGVSTQVSLVERLQNHINQATGVGQIVLLSYIDATAGNGSALGSALLNSSDPGHQAALNRLSSFIDLRLPDYNAATIGPPKTITTPNVKSNAWSVDFSATPSTTTTQLPDLDGQAILVVGHNSTYYFLVDAADYNWQSNQTTWQQVIDSLKVDQ
jgi:hypothetical protein